MPGSPPSNIAIERFVNATVLDEPAVDAIDDDRPSSDATTLTITIKRKRHTLDHVAGDTVLDAARRRR